MYNVIKYFLQISYTLLCMLKEKQNVWILSDSLRVQTCWTCILHLDIVVFNLARSPAKSQAPSSESPGFFQSRTLVLLYEDKLHL